MQHIDLRSMLLLFRDRVSLDFSNLHAMGNLVERSMTQTVRQCLFSFRDLAGFGHVDIVNETACNGRYKPTGFRIAMPNTLKFTVLETLMEIIHKILLSVYVPQSSGSSIVSTYETLWYRIPHIWYDSANELLTHLSFYMVLRDHMQLRYVWINRNTENGKIELVESAPDVIRFTRWLRIKRCNEFDVVMNINTGLTHPYRDDIVSTFETERPKNSVHVDDRDAMHLELHPTKYKISSVRNDPVEMFLLMTSNHSEIDRFYFIGAGKLNPYPIFRHHLPSPTFEFGDRQCDTCGANIAVDEPYLTIDAQLGIYRCRCKFPWRTN